MDARFAALIDLGLPGVAATLRAAAAAGRLSPAIAAARADADDFGLLSPEVAAAFDALDAPPDEAPAYTTGQLTLMGHAGVVAFGTAAFRVACIPRDKANDLIIRGHYSGKVFPLSEEHHGVFIEGALVGVLQWGPGMNPGSGAGIVAGTENGTWLELNRMWLDDAAPHGIATRAIAYSLRLIRRRRPEVAWVQSFADERCGKIGLVYRAANFTYLGEHTSIFWELDGEWYHNIAATVGPAELRKRKGAAKLQANMDRAIRHEFRQFRYFYALKRSATRNLLLTPQPYPPRAATPAPEADHASP
jgi:hypothetical protein